MPTEVPRGRDETVTALIEAMERLCASTPPNLVTVRDVAKEAGVTLGLVHHYFESKDELVVATLQAISRDVDAVAATVLEATSDPAEMVRAVWRVFDERPAFAYIVGWWLLEGRNVTEMMGRHPFLERLAVALGAAGVDDPPTEAAAIGIVILAGTALRPGFNRAIGRPGDDAVLAVRLERALVDLTNNTTGSRLIPDRTPDQ